VDQATRGVPAGLEERACRAALLLGLLGRREATPTLAAALDAPDGWLQAAAATALGDLGDPAAAVALCRKIAYRGDVLRPRDQWIYPGLRETNVAPEDWDGIDYFAVDVAAADALLRMGVRGAAGWLVAEKLDPSRAWFRIRVLQDAVDALLRSLPPDAPVAAYRVDAGVPFRREAFLDLHAWWTAHRFDDPGLFPATDEGWLAEARRLVEHLRGRSVMELQIAQESCALLGAAVTPVLLEALAGATHRVLRTEIARALGSVRDDRAVPALLQLLGEPAPVTRAVAARSLAEYADRVPAVEPTLVRLLDDPEPGVRVAALQALAGARPTATLAAVVRAHPPAAFAERFGADREYEIAHTVVSLVQEGRAHWPAIAAGLKHSERAVRASWWGLLRQALGLPGSLYDPGPAPDDPEARAVDEDRVLHALGRRRLL
jgi:hypothetical protein